MTETEARQVIDEACQRADVKIITLSFQGDDLPEPIRLAMRTEETNFCLVIESEHGTMEFGLSGWDKCTAAELERIVYNSAVDWSHVGTHRKR